jgi:hypothetical protein
MLEYVRKPWLQFFLWVSSLRLFKVRVLDGPSNLGPRGLKDFVCMRFWVHVFGLILLRILHAGMKSFMVHW